MFTFIVDPIKCITADIISPLSVRTEIQSEIASLPATQVSREWNVAIFLPAAFRALLWAEVKPPQIFCCT